MHGNATHGMSKTRIYHVWVNMHQRCSNPEHVFFAAYGGAGVKVCRRWHRFENFYADMGPDPGRGLTLERMNNAVGYNKANCAWVTRKAQVLNRRMTIWIEHDGKIQCLKDWARELRINYLTLYTRMYRRNLSFEEAIAKRI
jgi:hypothetical protein